MVNSPTGSPPVVQTTATLRLVNEGQEVSSLIDYIAIVPVNSAVGDSFEIPGVIGPGEHLVFQTNYCDLEITVDIGNNDGRLFFEANGEKEIYYYACGDEVTLNVNPDIVPLLDQIYTVTFANTSQLPDSIVGSIFITDSDDPFFGLNQLEDTVLFPGELVNIDLPACNKTYDYLVEDTNGETIAEQYGVFLPCGSERETLFEINADMSNFATILVTNEGQGFDSTVGYFYARPAEQDLLAIEWLGDDVLLANESIKFETNECNADFSFVAQNLDRVVIFEQYGFFVACGDEIQVTLNTSTNSSSGIVMSRVSGLRLSDGRRYKRRH